jgi:hypothetical protein
MDRGELPHARGRIGVHAGDELKLRFAEVRRDVRVGERGSERGRMRRLGESTVGQHAQALFLDPAPQPLQYVWRERGQALLGERH